MWSCPVDGGGQENSGVASVQASNSLVGKDTSVSLLLYLSHLFCISD